MTALILEFPERIEQDGRHRARCSPLRPDARKYRRPVSAVAMDWCWTQAVDGPRLLVLLALAKRVRPKSDQATPSMPELVHMTGMSETTVRDHVQALAKAHVIEVAVSNGGRHRRSVYTLPGVLTPRDLWGSKPLKTPQQPTPKKSETPQIPRSYPSGDAPVVLRTKRVKEVVSTTDAAAPVEAQPELFPVEVAAKPGTDVVVPTSPDLARGLNARSAVEAWCDAYAGTHDARPTREQTGQVGKEAASLLKAGNPPERVTYAARAAGARGFATVRREYGLLAKRRDVTQPTAHASAPRPSTTDARVAAGIALAEKYARQEATG